MQANSKAAYQTEIITTIQVVSGNFVVEYMMLYMSHWAFQSTTHVSMTM